MIRKGLIFLFISSGISACGVPDNVIVVHGLAKTSVDSATGNCESIDVNLGTERPTVSYLDTAVSLSLNVPLLVTNNLSDAENDIGTGDTELKVDYHNSVTPLRYSLKWECDSTAFSGGALIIPHFSAEDAFCYDTRNTQSSGAFSEFDIVPVSGFPIDPQGSSAWFAQIIPPEFGQHIQDAFNIAQWADECCAQSSNCSGNRMPGAAPACDKLEALFSTIDPNGEKGLIVASEDPEVASPLLTRFAPFSVFNNFHLATNLDTNKYAVRQRGVFEAATPDGQTLQSAEVVTRVNMGQYMGTLLNLEADPMICGGATVCRTPIFDACTNL